MALQLGGATAPTATPTAATASNPTIRTFNLTRLDGDSGATAFNHGVSAANAGSMICFTIDQIATMHSVYDKNAITWTPTQVTLNVQSDVGLGGTVPGTTVVKLLVVMNIHSLIA